VSNATSDRSSQPKVSEEVQKGPKTTPITEEDRTVSLDPHLHDFMEHAELFKKGVIQLFELNGESSPYSLVEAEAAADDGQSESIREEGIQGPALSALVAASKRLSLLSPAFPESLQVAARVVFPSVSPKVPPAPSWAPILAWFVFQTLPPHFRPVEVFEKLNLRWALAETFSSVGLEGDAAWKAAAQVSVLLRFAGKKDPLQIFRTENFWQDPDVRWLAGVNTASGVEYINLERFEELLCWVELPTLLGLTANPSTSVEDVASVTSNTTDLVSLLQQSRFEYQSFLRLLLLDTAVLEVSNSTTSDKYS
jgi:hypothetical protein